MGLFDWLKRIKKVELTEEDPKWNKMWALWAENRIGSPYAELMTYQSEINNGGHSQYFCNTENTGDLQKEMSTLERILSSHLRSNLQKAYKAYLVLETNDEDAGAEAILEQCDDVFYEHEEEIISILKKYAAGL
ncbi:MAG: DUF4375 domain-containing protein [Oscillospiraceae bacterium]|nr:DUF4375 domain-containing protein [Oscillospiraceae bacterium]